MSHAPLLPRLRSWIPALLLLAAALAAPRHALASESGPSLSCGALRGLMYTFLRDHVLYHNLDESLRSRVSESYVQRVDGSRALFLESEAEELEREVHGDFDALLGGDCSRLEKVHKDVAERAKKMEEFVRDMVSDDDYQVDKDVSLVIDPAKRGYPKTPAAREGLYRALVHFQMSNYVSSGMPLDEARKNLVHRYELLTKQIREQDSDETYGLFLDAFATALDPHSDYFTPDDAEDFQISMGLSLEGVGIELSPRDGYAVVERLVPGGAADREGSVKAGDKIVAVTQEGGQPVDVIDMKFREVVRLIRGKKGSPVTLSILRQAEKTERVSVTIIRDKIVLEQQAARLRFEEAKAGDRTLKLAVLELPSFYGDRDESKLQSKRDVQNLLRRVRQEKADGLLLDLSRNGGGLLEYAIEISGFFLREGGIVAVRQGRQPVRVFNDPDGSIQYTGPMVVLTSRVSASASEILAGALKDYRRAVIVGDDQTFGKGTVQNVMALPPGLGMLKVTTQMFFRPGGQSTQRFGVNSDIVLPSLSDNEEFGESALPWSLPGQTIPAFLSGADGDAPIVWHPVTTDVVGALAEKSKARVAASPEFAEIEKQLVEARQNEGVVHLADMQKRNGAKSDKPQADAGSPDEKDDTKKPSAQQREALNILADYVVLERQRMIAGNGG